jgi:dTDP-4-amino-4,6-dideoxygalactose transaminase
MWAGTLSSYHLYALRFDFRKMKTTRGALMRRLAARGIGTQVHYIPVTRQPYYRKRFGTRAGDFPVAEAYYESALSIPIFPAMTSSEIHRVADEIEKACK